MNHELDFPAGIWEPFAKSRPPVRCSPGYLIYLQNTQATCFYYLKSGKVKSFIQSEDGGERVLNLYTAGSLFGEASFFDELPRVSSAVAVVPCEIVPIDRELVTQEFARNPELALAMMQYLARTVRLLSGQVDQMAFRPARWRVANYLLTLSPEARGTFVGRYYYMDPVREIARYFGMSESKAKSMLHRTRLGLRRHLEQEGFL